VLTQALGLKAWTWRQAQLQEIGETEIAMLLNETFPDLQALQDPIPMMQQRMAGLWANSAATAPTDLSALLYALAAAQAPAPRDIDYADGQLLLTPSDQAPLDRSSAWIQSLSAQGYLLEDTGGRWTIRPRNP
jgi:general secretion pathway protein L